MRFYPARIHFAFACLILTTISLNFGCSKDTDLLLDSVTKENSDVSISEQELEVNSESEDQTTDASEDSDEVSSESFESRSTSFSPSNDAHIQSGKGYNQNIIRLEENFRTSYLMFDLSPIIEVGGSISKATLQITINSDDGSGNIRVHKGSSNDWSEENLSESTVPASDLLLGEIIKEYKIGTTEIIELDAAAMLPELSTLILSHKDGNDLAFASKEHLSNIGPKLVVEYNVPEGSEEITLTEEESTGGSAEDQSSTEEESSQNGDPIAIADATPSSGGAPLEVTFTGSNSTDDLKIESYTWNFNDGTTSNNPNPIHIFTDAGVYTVELSVQDEKGLSSTDTVTITVTEDQNEAPNAIVSATSVTGEAPLEVNFKGSDSTDDHSISSYEWDFKDGSKTNVADFTYTYTTPGTYNAELTVTDENGLTDKKTITITVTEPQNLAPTAVVTANPISGTAPLDVQFIGDNSSDDSGITSYYWDFKDGSSSNSSNPLHTFNQAGTYVVGFAVTDAQGVSSSTSITITVNPSANNNNNSDGNAPPGYYVSTNGNSYNNGTTPSTPWSLAHAFNVAKAGDIVYVKAGNYGNLQLRTNNAGNGDSPIKFIGYTNTPGDVVSNNGSTFNYGESLNAGKMPLLQSYNAQGTAITLHDRNIHIENFQITGYEIGIQTINLATNATLKNVIVTNVGNQSSAGSYTGVGLKIESNNALLENCFVLNAGAEAITLSDSDFSRVNYCKVYANNNGNPTDYYFLLTGGTNNTVVENSLAERENYLSHPGHGFDMKDLAENNTFRNCTAKRTNFELNFSGVRYNTIIDCNIYGTNTSSSNWEAVMAVFNGANNNLIKNMYIQDTWAAIYWGDYNDGYVGPGGDRDEVSLGYDNTFEGIVVQNTNRFLNIGGGNQFAASAKRNKLINCQVTNFEFLAVTYYRTEDITIQNSKFSNGINAVVESQGQYAPYSNFNVSWINNTWTNVSFTPPN